MKHTVSSLAEFAATVSKKKFQTLSSKRQHELLAALAEKTLERGDINHFKQRYETLQSWTDLDRLVPPKRLSDREALTEYIAFHHAFTPNPLVADTISPSLSWEPTFDVTLFLDQVRSPYNAGSALRIIDNFGLKELVHATPTLNLEHPQLKKSARGCERWVPVRYEPNPEAWLNNSNLPVIGIEKTDDAVDIIHWDPPEHCILIGGNEEYGISESIRACCTETVQIPMFGFKKSMNVHQALSVVVHKVIEASVRRSQEHPRKCSPEDTN